VQAERLRELMNNKVIHAPLSASSAGKMMDIGCGTGIVTNEIATTFPRARVYGLDLSPVPNVREKLPNIEYVQGNVMELSDSKTRDPRFENGSFDLIFSRLLIAGMTDWKGYVERCVALTKPGVSSTESVISGGQLLI
jgi:trans-aconitate methyltransferase